MAKTETLFLHSSSALALTLALLFNPALFADDFFGVDTTRAPLASLSAVTQEFLAQRSQIPPYPNDYVPGIIHSAWRPVLASLDAFPAAFSNGLVSVDRNGCTVYPVTCIQIRELESIVFINADGNVIDTMPYTDDSGWNNPPWNDDYYLRCQDPAHVGITLYLVTAEDLATADVAAELQAEIDAAAAEAAVLAGGGLRQGGMQSMDSMQSLLDATYTNLTIAGVQAVSNGLELTIGLPDGWANRLDVLVSDDLGPFLWRWRALLLDATNGVSFAWVDTNAPAIDRTFYVLGNADIDGDGDGLPDAIERYIDKSCPTNIDTDADGLVDGSSGVVPTNTCPTGVTTNGGLYVEGERTRGTSPTLFDTDDDGMGDGWEVAHGHNPLDVNDPPNVRGTLGYSGGQTGPVLVLAVETSDSWATNHAVSLNAPGAYRIPNLTATNYWIKALVDSNGNNSNGLAEAWGAYSTNAIEITNKVVGIDFALADPDLNTNSIPDWWEIANFGSTTNSGAGADPDGDEYTNLEEYQAGTDPNNIASHPWNVSGTIAYAGPQTGTIWVVASATADGWTGVRSNNIAQAWSYTITHLPPNTNYWIWAWRDTDGDTDATYWEAWGEHAGNPVFLDGNITNIDLTLTDPDNDGDGLPDWWEALYGLDAFGGVRSDAAGWWRLDASSGTNVMDSSANANHGVLWNATSNAWTGGVVSNGLRLDGTNSYVQLTDSASLKPSFVSVALWMRPDRDYTNGSAAFFSKRVTSGSAGYSLGYENGKLAFTVCASGTKAVQLSCTLSNGVWRHLAGTYGGQYQRLYVDGVLAVETNYDWGTGFGEIAQDTVNPRIGATADAVASNRFAGTLDDVLVFGQELSSNRVAGLYQEGADFDQDGLSNRQEFQAGTCPTNSDTDGDGMLDGLEVKYGLSPLSAGDALEDRDGDGYLNIYEVLHGGDPTSSNSIPTPTHTITNGAITIQAMINSVTQDYAIVMVKAGTYTNSGNRDIDFGRRNLMLVSETGPSNTIIDCENAGRGFYFQNGETRASVLKGLTITRGKADYGGAIRCYNSSPWIDDCTIISNRFLGASGDYAGAGLCVDSGKPLVTRSRFVNNGNYLGAATYGGAMALMDAAVVSNCTISGNTATSGGGIYFSVNAGAATGTLANCTVVTNSANNGGGIYASNDLLIENCGVSSNVAGNEGGGLWIAGNVRISVTKVDSNIGYKGGGIRADATQVTNVPTLVNVDIVGNRATYAGGGLFYEPGCQIPLIISNCSVVGNTAVVYGGIHSAGAIDMHGGCIKGNTGGHAGGAYMVGNGPFELSGVEISGNTAVSNGYSYSYCGGLEIQKNIGDPPIVLTSLLVSNNCAAAYGNGGLYVHGQAPVLMTGCEIVDNTSIGAGGMYMNIDGTSAISIILNCRFSRNSGHNYAGGLYAFAAGQVFVGKSIFENNISSNNAGGLYLACSGGPALLLDSALIGNQAAGSYGAGIVAGGMQNCTIVSNRANNTSGGVWDSGCGGLARNCIVWGNTGAQLAGLWYAEYSCIQGDYTQNRSYNIITNNPCLVEGYRLLYTNTPCVNAGTTNGISETDVDGKPRNSGNAPDIGCSELSFTDSDSDGLLDEWEIFTFGDLDETAIGDTDDDGLNNLAEYNAHTDPNAYDTDRDGLPDGWEMQYGLDPNGYNDPTQDSDRDGWTDGQEADQGTDPTDWDTDGDGTDDFYDADPLDPANAEEATPENSCNLKLTVGDSSGSHTEMYLIKVGQAFLRMAYVSGSEYLFYKTIRLPRGNSYEGYVEAIGDSDNDGDYDADVTSEDSGVNVIDPNGYLGGHHEDTGFNSGRRYFQVSLGSTAANTNTAANADPSHANTIDPINTQNGNVALSATDVAIPCPGLPLAFGRYYNSRAAVTNGILGPCWAHSYETFLQSRSNATYKGVSGNWQMLSLPQGQEFWFQDNGDGTYQNPPDNNLRLALAGGGWVVTQAGGAQWDFDANGVLNGIADAFSNRVTLTYAGTFPNHKLSRVEHLNGQFLDLSYTGARLTRIDTPVGSLSVQFTYNANDELAVAVRNAGGAAYTNRYLYDAGTHSLTQRVNAAGDRFDYGYQYTNLAGRTVSRGISMTLEPDYYRHTVNYTNRGANATEVTYNRNGVDQTYVYKYDPVVNLIKAQLGPGGTNLGVRYTINGKRDTTQETRFDDAIGEYANTLMSYDTNHNLTFLGFALNAASTTNWTAFTWSDNLPASVKDAEGSRVEFEYTNGLLKTTKAFADNSIYFSTRYDYTANGLLCAVTNANGHWQRFAYDAYGFMTSAVPQVGPAIDLEHNRLGFVTSIALPGSSGSRATAIGVTELGWVTNILYPDGLGATFEYDSLGQLTNQVDRAGRTNRLSWLPTGKLASISRFLQQGTTNQELRTEFTYDNQFNTLTITDPMGRAVERYALDLQDRPLAVTNLEGQVMAINWGLGDYVKSITRFDGTLVSNSYNTAGLLSQLTGPSFTNVFGYYRNGALKTAANGSSAIANSFDLAGRLTARQSTCGDWTNTVTYQSDPVGNVTNVTVANTPVQFAWTYDEAERPLSLTAQAASDNASVFQWTYNADNGLVAAVTNAAITKFLDYDVLDRATNIAWKTAGGTTVRSFGYAFSAAGMLTNISREDGGWIAYTYDSLDRLTSEKQYGTGGGLSNSASWTYDLADNRTMAVTNGVTNLYAYASGNRVTNFGPNTLVQYDLAGNTTNLQYSASRKLGLYWDGQYQLTEVRTNGVTVEKYDYDVLGRRVRIAAGSVTNTLIYDGPHLVAEYSNGTLIRTYTYGPGVDNILSFTTHYPVTNTYYCLKDHLGSVHALVTTNGAVVEQYRYTAWGETTVLSSNGTVLANSAYGNRFTWQGREISWKTGLLHFRSRYYSPTLGRWLSNDPIGISGGLNQYVFCENNPVNFVDPFGLVIHAASVGEQRTILIALAGFLRSKRGGLGFDQSGNLYREPCSKDKDIEADIDRLIAANQVYTIHAYSNGDYGHFDPVGKIHGIGAENWGVGQGGDIYFDPKGGMPYNNGNEIASGTQALAHELLGRALNDLDHVQVGVSGSSMRDNANTRAMNSANRAWSRMGLELRHRYGQ